MEKKEVCRIYAWRDEEGDVGADWEFPNQIGTMTMIGILNVLIHDLNKNLDAHAKEKDDGIAQ